MISDWQWRLIKFSMHLLLLFSSNEKIFISKYALSLYSDVWSENVEIFGPVEVIGQA